MTLTRSESRASPAEYWPQRARGLHLSMATYYIGPARGDGYYRAYLGSISYHIYECIVWGDKGGIDTFIPSKYTWYCIWYVKVCKHSIVINWVSLYSCLFDDKATNCSCGFAAAQACISNTVRSCDNAFFAFHYYLMMHKAQQWLNFYSIHETSINLSWKMMDVTEGTLFV